jgi:hypothetical protein
MKKLASRIEPLRSRAEELRARALGAPSSDERATLLQLALAWDRAADRKSRPLVCTKPRNRPDPELVRNWQLRATLLRRQAVTCSEKQLRRALLNSARQLERAARGVSTWQREPGAAERARLVRAAMSAAAAESSGRLSLP